MSEYDIVNVNCISRPLHQLKNDCFRYLDAKGSNDDPLTQAFDLNTKLEKRASDEPELKKEYLKISERCKKFATDLYNGCQSMDEITALLDIASEKQSNSSCELCGKKVVKKLRRAIESDHKEVGRG
jgi:hypothetical protein